MKEHEESVEELRIQKATADRLLLLCESVIGLFCVALVLGVVLAASFLPMETASRVVLIVCAAAVGFAGLLFALKLEQVAGFYKCAACGHCHIPSFRAVLLAMHCGTTRYLKCPMCGKRTWNKKVLHKD